MWKILGMCRYEKELLFFQESDIKWASRWDTYLTMSDVQIHWFSIINSVVVVFFLSGEFVWGEDGFTVNLQGTVSFGCRRLEERIKKGQEMNISTENLPVQAGFHEIRLLPTAAL